MGEARRERPIMAAHSAPDLGSADGAWRVVACAICVLTLIASCAPAPGIATRTAPPAGGPAQVSAPRPMGGHAPSSDPPKLTFHRLPADSLLGVWMPVMSLPRVDSIGRLDWSPKRRWSAAAADAQSVQSRRVEVIARRDGQLGADSLGDWLTIAADSASVLRPYALRRVWRMALADGDTLAAQQALEALSAIASPWGWEALRTRCDLAMAAGQPARAESLLNRARTSEWPPLDLSTLRMRQATLAETRGDTLLAGQRAREVLGGFPAMPTAVSAIALLQRIATARGATLRLEDLRQAAESARLRGDRVATIDWLARAHAAASGPTRTRISIQWARALRESRRFDGALATLASALRPVPSAALAAELRLERARCYRDAGRSSEAVRAYVLIERDSLSSDLGTVVGWEHGLELVAQGRTAEARDVLRHSARRKGERSRDAILLCGLLWIADGLPERATSEWQAENAEGEAFTFWRAVLKRKSADPAERFEADSALAAIAAGPGYSFYRVAARDTLHLVAFPGIPAPPAACPTLRHELELAEALIVLGDNEAATLVLQRMRADILAHPGNRTGSAANGCGVPDLLEACRLALGMNQIPLAIRLAQNALDESARVESRDGEWFLNTLRYPPALDSLYGALPEPRGTDPVDRALLRAVAWQESRFDPRARSKSDALGLYQLKLATAGDMARRLGEAPPDREAMFDPATSLRYGREYLHWLLERFGNHWPVAVSAYNSGPTPVSRQWRTLLDRGGAALFCELIGRAETRDYVRNIMGARAAYRELRPYPLSDSAVTAPR